MTNSSTNHQSPLHVAIIGYGLAGAVFHAPLVASTPGMTVAAVVTQNPDRRNQVQRDFPEAEILESPDDIWKNPKRFDLVVVATPNTAHAPLATASVHNGIPVVVDKPMALSIEEAQALIAASERTRVPVVPFQNRRWDGDFLTVQRLLQDGRLGSVTRFESRFERYRPAVRSDGWREHTSLADGGGLLWDLGSHLVDQALLLFGRPVRVYAEMPHRRPHATVDDDSFVAVTFESGVTAHLWMSVTAAIPGPRFRISGIDGAYEKYGLDPQEAALRSGERPDGSAWGAEPESAWGRLHTGDGDEAVETLPGAYHRFYAGVRDAIVRGAPVPVDPRDAANGLEVIEAAQKSAGERTVVHLRSPG